MNIDRVEFFEDDNALEPFLARSDILINVLPLTPATENLLNSQRFASMPTGACLINVSRGATVVEEDLLAALDSGHLGAAALDVFRNEPLSYDNALWQHPRVFVTPHIAGINYPQSAARIMGDNIRRMQKGDQPFPVYYRQRGY